jgi:hypothetical protein
MVEEIEGFKPKLQVGSLADVKTLQQRGVYVIDGILAKVAKSGWEGPNMELKLLLVGRQWL